MIKLCVCLTDPSHGSVHLLAHCGLHWVLASQEESSGQHQPLHPGGGPDFAKYVVRPNLPPRFCLSAISDLHSTPIARHETIGVFGVIAQLFQRTCSSSEQHSERLTLSTCKSIIACTHSELSSFTFVHTMFPAVITPHDSSSGTIELDELLQVVRSKRNLITQNLISLTCTSALLLSLFAATQHSATSILSARA